MHETVLHGSRLRAAPATGKGCAVRVRVRGIVQGVGFRPFVSGLARACALAGSVLNDGEGVLIEIEGETAGVEGFLSRLGAEAPPLAVVESIEREAVPARGRSGFTILASRDGGERQALVSPDTSTCEACLREMSDPGDRRFEYPFINCTHCGPRFTIVRGVPYDRPRTTMAGFAMCGECAREYADPADRRFHAQPISCPACGPVLVLATRDGAPVPGPPIEGAAALLREGKILAVKGLGGYHLAALASHEGAVAMLRARKHREDKPFAVMAPDLAAARRLALVGDAEARALEGPRRPIVLCRRAPGADLAKAVAPGNRCLGLMLPYTPLHHLLARRLGAPFVLTSGNVSDEPIAFEDADARARLAPIADAFLWHDRPIETRTDDSVVRVFFGRERLVRRSRGFAPQPLLLAKPARRPILACGAELKSTFCLVKGRYAFLSHHIGDLENWETLRAFTAGIEHYERLFDVAPLVIAHDLHPDYHSTQYAREREGAVRVGVQHHHAHIASCLADNGEEGPVIGVAFDGLGYGPDGTLWGGELLIADLCRFTRAGHIETMPMPGGAAAIRQPWRMALSWLAAAYGDALPEDLDVRARNGALWGAVDRLRGARLTPRTSSAGRLFDAVASVLGIRDVVRYEGQAAVELEQRADPAERGVYPVRWSEGDPIVVRGTDIVRAVVEEVRGGTPVPVVAARVHNTLARTVTDVCTLTRSRHGIGTVALSGGVFQNVLLLERTVDGLEREGFRVLVHRRVPPNDGGISFGQAAVAAARDLQGSGAS